MSSANATQEIVSVAEAGFCAESCYLSALVIAVYDHCLVLDEEIKFIWRRKCSIPTLLFFTLRVITLLLYVTYITPAITCKVDYVLVMIGLVALAVLLLSCAAIDVLRIYAVSRRDWRISSFASALLLINVVYYLYQAATLRNRIGPSPTSCDIYPATNPHTLIEYYTAVVGFTVGNALVLGVTWWRTYHVKRLIDAANMCHTSVATLLLRDGSIYFGSTLLVSLAMCVIDGLASLSAECTGIPSLMTVLNSVLLTRFLLNLREAAPGPRSSSNSSSSGPEMPDIRIPSYPALGSIGGSTAHGADGNMDEDNDAEGEHHTACLHELARGTEEEYVLTELTSIQP
ncbi:hypothetical protein DAEQUDRAFT_277491 [Daedalea quercina L-15889]|uniref:DUF6533 domain-containing protein n=1 Tax=Daedalea quercina L-15889 TaxID=1314783 RepID=A0A165Q7Y3_9APHY|nr:hypothetical protein DAEQUDRAFT_277491 [Daedalea quercina L-15889]